MSFHSNLHLLITQALEQGMCEYDIIELIIDEGIPSEAASIILNQYMANTVTD
jgi:hypothetical protein